MDILHDMATQLQRNLRTVADSEITAEQVDLLLFLAERLFTFAVLSTEPLLLTILEQSIYLLQNVVDRLWEFNASLSVDEQTHASLSGYTPTVIFSGAAGRPKICLTREILEYFIGNGFSATQVAMLTHVSLSTVRRRMSEFGLSIRSLYSDIHDSDLDRVVVTVLGQHPHFGYRLMRGYLAALGYHLQQSHVREAMIRVDPVGVLSRRHGTIVRRTYSVPTPNALWHIDGYHRLIRWDITYAISLNCTN